MPRKIRGNRVESYRCCSRCGLPLEDVASQEAGVGPICRRKTNQLLAQSIPCNLVFTSGFIGGLEAGDFHEKTRDSWEKIQERFEEILTSGVFHDGNGTESQFARVGADFRDIVSTIDYILSWPQSRETRENMLALVGHLGYPGMAAVLSGEASTSPASVRFEDGRLLLECKANKAGYLAMRREVPGVKCPRYRGDRNPYSAPAGSAAKFMSVVRRFWPMCDSDLIALESQALAYGAANPVDERPVVRVVMRSLDFVLSFQYNAEVVSAIKTSVVGSERNYNPQTRMWVVRRSENMTEARLREIFDAVGHQVNLVGDGTDPTPDADWARTTSPSYGRPYFRGRGRRVYGR